MEESMGIVGIISLFLGGGGLVGFITGLCTIRYMRWKAKGEAHGAKYEGMKVEQDTYQELIDDLNADRKRMKEDAAEREAYIKEIKEDRRQLRTERDELRKEIVELRDKQQKQDWEIAGLKKMTESLKILICANVGCKERQKDILGLVADDSFDAK